MGFTKMMVGDNEIQEIEKNIERIKVFLKSDCLIFNSKEITEKFRNYEEKYYRQRTSIK